MQRQRHRQSRALAGLAAVVLPALFLVALVVALPVFALAQISYRLCGWPVPPRLRRMCSKQAQAQSPGEPRWFP